jgi:hypothetical protein
MRKWVERRNEDLVGGRYENLSRGADIYMRTLLGRQDEDEKVVCL